MVSIDAKFLALRGPMPDLELDIFYTTNGEEPSIESKVYEGAFPVSLGTTVKALVTIDGEATLLMQERFAEDEGSVWNDYVRERKTRGEQAEDAKFEGARVASQIEGYQGDGYLTFVGDDESYAEWYQENDGDEAAANLTIRYLLKTSKKPSAKLLVFCNTEKSEHELTPSMKEGQDSLWQTLTIPISLQRGANVVRLSPARNAEIILIDEVIIE